MFFEKYRIKETNVRLRLLLDLKLFLNIHDSVIHKNTTSFPVGEVDGDEFWLGRYFLKSAKERGKKR